LDHPFNLRQQKMNEDIRWIQRFENYLKAFENLKEGVGLSNNRKLSNLEEQGLVKSFEFTFELAWKTLKDYLTYMEVEVKFPREVLKSAFKYELIDDGDIWMDMLQKRNLMAHTYDETNAQTAIQLITGSYFSQLDKVKTLLNGKRNSK
tara:strand:- start:6570 stop:7016 length:447 start_codon:yes stop_codon:yes gene_type:complete